MKRAAICLTLSLAIQAYAEPPLSRTHDAGAGPASGPTVSSINSCDIAPTADVTASALAEARRKGMECGLKIRGLKPGFGKDIDPKKKESAFAECLASYVQQKTIYGKEELSAAFLNEIFAQAGIPSKCFYVNGLEPGTPPRMNIVATLTGSNARDGLDSREPFDWTSHYGKCDSRKGPSVILLNHTDVVDVSPQQWEKPEYTFGGQIEPDPKHPDGEKFIWGRGSLDMKPIGMSQVFSMAILKMKRARLFRNIHFLGVADEEQSATGAKGAVKEIRCGGRLEALMGAKVVLNEGGLGVSGALGPNTIVHTIGTEEKGGAWMRLGAGDPKAILASLSKLGLIPVADRKTRVRQAKSWGCELVSFNTFNQGVNVVASDVGMTLNCKKTPSKDLIEKAFAIGLTGGVKAEVNGNKVNIRLQTSTSSHGSLGLNQSALESTALGLQRIYAYTPQHRDHSGFFRYYATPASVELLKTAARHFAPVPGVGAVTWAAVSAPWIRDIGLKLAGEQFSSERLFRTSCTWTGFDLNPGSGQASLDCRLLSPAIGLKSKDQGAEFAGRVQDYLNRSYYAGGTVSFREPSNVKVKTLVKWNYTQSPMAGPEVTILKEELQRQWPGSMVTPFLFPAGTDNPLFRDPKAAGSELDPVPSYGFFPIVMPPGLPGTQHGSNERFPVSQILPVLNTYERVVERLAQ